MPKSKKRKGAYMKETMAHRKAQIHRKRRNPEFRKHEKKSRDEVTLATSYLTNIVHERNNDELFAKYEETLERMGGIEGIHEYLVFLDALKPDWEDRLEDNGLLSLSAISADGIDFALQNEEDQQKAIGVSY